MPTDIYDRTICRTPIEITSEFNDFDDYSKNIYGPCTSNSVHSEQSSSYLPEIVRRTVLRRARNKISSRKSRHNTKLNLELQNIRRAEKKLRVACKRISILIRTLNQ